MPPDPLPCASWLSGNIVPFSSTALLSSFHSALWHLQSYLYRCFLYLNNSNLCYGSLSASVIQMFLEEIFTSLCTDNIHKKHPLCLALATGIACRTVALTVSCPDHCHQFSGLWRVSRSGEILSCLFSVLSQPMLSWDRCLLFSTQTVGVRVNSCPVAVH